MKTLVFSDTHLTTKFKPKLFTALRQTISGADRVIINGDFFDGYVVTFEQFVNSQWQQLFPLLIDKEAIYIYGNHDKSEMVTEQARQFSTQQKLKHTLKMGQREIIIMHGHTLAPEFDGLFPNITERFGYLYPFFYNLHYQQTSVGRFYRFLKGFHYRQMMRQLRQYANTQLKQNQLLVAGHSHQVVDDREHGFISPGAFQRGRARYLVLDDQSNEIRLYNQRY